MKKLLIMLTFIASNTAMQIGAMENPNRPYKKPIGGLNPQAPSFTPIGAMEDQNKALSKARNSLNPKAPRFTPSLLTNLGPGSSGSSSSLERTLERTQVPNTPPLYHGHGQQSRYTTPYKTSQNIQPVCQSVAPACITYNVLTPQPPSYHTAYLQVPVHTALTSAQATSINDPNYAIQEAVRRNEPCAPKLIQQAAQQGKINQADQKSQNLLHHAAHFGHQNLVAHLLQHGADITAQDIYGNTPLHNAVRQQHDEPVKLLLQHAHENNINIIDTPDKSGLTPLHIAAFSGHQKIVELLLQHGANITVKSKKGTTAANCARQQKHFDIEQLIRTNNPSYAIQQAVRSNAPYAPKLIQQAAQQGKINQTDQKLKNLLHHAAYFGHENLVAHLLQHDADMTAQDINGNTPLHSAVKQQHDETVKLLLQHAHENNINIIDTPDKSGLTPLHAAALSGHQKIVELLLQHGANITVKSKKDMTAADCAREQGHLDIEQLILTNDPSYIQEAVKYNAPCAPGLTQQAAQVIEAVAKDTNKQNRCDSHSLHNAVNKGQLATTQQLLEYAHENNTHIIDIPDRHGQTPLHTATFKGHKEIVELLLKYGADITAQDAYGNTPLHTAVRQKHHAIVQLLLSDRTCDTNTQNRHFETPLHIAASIDDIETIKLLHEKGATLNIRHLYGNTPLHYAYKFNNEQAVKLLIELGADANIENKQSKIPVQMKTLISKHPNVAVDNLCQQMRSRSLINNAESLRKIIQQISPNPDMTHTQDSFGGTLLHEAAFNGYDTMIPLLIERGANINAQDIHGRTPLHLAANKNHMLCVKTLLKKNADISIKNHKGRTALFDAARGGNVQIFSLLLEHYKTQYPDTDHLAARDSFGGTLLHSAVRKNNILMAQYLLDNNPQLINLSATERQGVSPLHIAVHDNLVEMARLLLQRGADTTIQENNGNTPLKTAAHEGRDEIFQLILEHDKSAINIPNNQGFTPLHSAAYGGSAAIAKLILSYDASSATTPSNNNHIPLQIAQLHGHQEIVEILSPYCTATNIQFTDKVSQRTTPVSIALTRPSVQVTSQDYAIEEAVRYNTPGAPELIQQAAQQGIINKQDKKGQNLLHHTAHFGYKNLAILLLQHDTDITAQDMYGNTPLHSAVRKQHHETVELLLQHAHENNINIIDTPDKSGLTPLHTASFNGNSEIVELLLKHGADPTIQSERGTTPADCARKQGHLGIVKLINQSTQH